MLGTIKDKGEVTVLMNTMEYLSTEKGQGFVAMTNELLPVVSINGKVFQFSRDELINYAYEHLTKE
jgi:hypothetical protein